jgi:hypothetical protein
MFAEFDCFLKTRPNLKTSAGKKATVTRFKKQSHVSAEKSRQLIHNSR